MRAWHVSVLILALALAACAPTATTPESGQAEAPAGLESRVATLEAQLAVPTDEHGDDGAAYQVAVTQFIMDNAGFHLMDETLAETQTVDPAFLVTTNRVRKVVAETDWPAELQVQADALHKALESFAAALEADDVDQAIALAEEVHEVEHDFSRSIDAWLGVESAHSDEE